MTKRTDWRKTCAELIENVRYLIDCVDRDCFDPVALMECREHLSQTRTALAQPEPEGVIAPSNRPIISAPKLSIFAVSRPTIEPVPVSKAEIDELTEQHCSDLGDLRIGIAPEDVPALVTAVLARYARPTIEPVPVPAPMSADTLAAIIREVDGTHRRLGAAALAEAILAHHAAINALPVPGAEVQS